MSASALRPTMPRGVSDVHAWLAGAPLSVTLALLLVVIRLVAVAWPGVGAVLAVSPSDPTRLWTLVTALTWTGSWPILLGALVLVLTAGVWSERTMGSARFLVAGAASAAGGVLVLQALYPALASVDARWASHLSSTVVGSGGAFVVGALAAGSARLDPLWRRRVRTSVLVSLATIVGFGGGAGDVVGLAAALVGLLLGVLAWRRGAPHRSLVGTPHDARALVSLVVVAVTVGTLLSAFSTFPVGPLAPARYGVEPQLLDPQTISSLCADPGTVRQCAQATYAARTRGLGPTVLAIMPLLLQLVLADGLRRGRRVAAVGTVSLQLLGALLAGLHMAAVWWVVRSSAQSAGPLGLGAHGVPAARLVVPVLVPLGLALFVLFHGRAFRVATRPEALRRWATVVALALSTTFALMLAFGATVDEQFVPEASVAALAADFGVRLLPSGALALLTPTLEPTTPLAVTIAEWSPILVWAVGAASLHRTLAGTPLTRGGDASTLVDLVRSRGAGTLGWMLTWPGRDVWLDEEDEAGVGYRAGNGVALTVTDPACAADAVESAVVGFATFAAQHSLTPALYSVHEPVAAAARRLGWTTVQVAEEAVLDLGRLSFTGKAFQDVRTALNRAGKDGIRAEWTTWASAPAGRRDQIRAIGAARATGRSLPEMGFTLGGLEELQDDETRLLLAVDADGTVHGVTSWLPVHRAGLVVGRTLDVMWRREGGFRPVMEFLIARAALDAQAEGLEVLSLSGAPLARSGPAPDGVVSRLDPVLDLLGAILEPAYGFRSLLAFKKKFGPRFEPLHLAVPDIMDAPAVGLAVARAYLPDLSAADAARFAQRLVSRD